MRRVLAAGLAAAVVVAGVTLLFTRADPEPARHKEPVAPQAAPAEITSAGDEASARSAAAAYVAASQDWLYLPDDRIAESVRAMATAGSADRLVAQVVGGVQDAREALRGADGRVWWIVRPLALRLDAFDGGRARVSVWTVSVLSATAVAVPQADWTTLVIDLLREGTAWRVDAIDERKGPTPTTGPSDRPWEASAVDKWLTGFQRLGAGGS